MLHEAHLETTGPRVKLSCRACQQYTMGQVLRRERRPYYFGIPLGVDRHVLVRCGNCGIEYFAPSLPVDTPEMCDVDPYLCEVNSPLYPKLLIVLMLGSCPLPLVPFLIQLCLWREQGYLRGPWKKLHKVAFWITVAMHLIVWLPLFAKDLMSK